MTREQLIDAIIESAEGMVGGMGNDFVSGLSPQETVFQNMLGRIVRKKRLRRQGFINPPIHETMGEFTRVGGRVLKKVKTSYKRNVIKPIRGTHRALKYKRKAEDMARIGRWGRSIEMNNRANRVLRHHAPVLAGAATGAATGVFFPSPGATEVGAVVGAKGGQLARRLAKVRL